ncbi:MAG: hypothetical protein HDR88_07405 [Bacteroides sp.]|nr:hypothetical protein [Bacteroides sp.]
MKRLITYVATAILASTGAIASNLPTTGKVRQAESNPDASAIVLLPVNQLGSKRMKAPAYTPDDVITQTPEGSLQRYVRIGNAYTNSFLGIGQTTVRDMLGSMIRTEDGTVYLYEPLTQIATHSWIKGEEKDGVITFKLPQAIYADDQGNVYNVQMAHYMSSSPDVEGIYYTNTEGQPCDLVFRQEGDNWVMESDSINDRPVILGMFNDQDEWVAYSDWDMVYTPFNHVSQTPPEGLQTSEWAMTYGAMDGRMVQVGFYENEIWILGMAGESWVRGNVDGNIVSLPSEQFLGVNSNERLLYFYAANEEERVDPDYGYTYTALIPQDAAVFDYDREKQEMRCHNSIVINTGTTSLNFYNALYSLPVIKVPSENPSLVPAIPVVELFNEFNPDWEMGSVYFHLSKLNVNDEFINTENIYYRVFIDDDLFYFDPIEYEGIEEPISDINFFFTNGYSISYYGATSHFFNFYIDGFDLMEIQAVYIDEDGTEYPSERAVAYDNNSVNVETPITSQIRKIEFFNLQGMKVSQPENGIYIRATTYYDGSQKNEKVIL